MRTSLVRGTLILFVSAMGFFGNGGHAGVASLSVSMGPETASARVMLDPDKSCDAPGRLTPCDNNGPDPWGVN